MASTTAYTVRTYSALRTALARTPATRITLGASIAVAEPVTIPERHTIIAGAHGFVQQGAGTIQFDGALEAEHRQVFYGFSPGQVQGFFRSEVTRPVWWGAYARISLSPESGDTSRDDIAINCAIQSTPALSTGRTIQLDQGSYYVARPLDMSGRSCTLAGQGSGSTVISATSGWTTDSWKDDGFYGSAVHGALVWIGSASASTASSFHSCVRDLHINGYYACTANTSKRISGISSYGWMEENTTVERVTVEYFSGYGIGVLSNTAAEASVRVINGLTIRNFWLTGGMSATCIPIAIGQNSTVAAVRDGTVDMNPGSGGSARPVTNVGIWAQGKHTVLENIHIESVRVGVLVLGSNSQGQCVSVKSVNLQAGYDSNMSAGGSVVTNPSSKHPDPSVSDSGDVFLWGSVLTIFGALSDFSPSGMFTGSSLPSHVRVTAEHLSSESVKYLVRDYIMGKHVQSWGTNQSNAHSGALSRYFRSTPDRPYPDNASSYYSLSGALGTYPSDGKTYAQVII